MLSPAVTKRDRTIQQLAICIFQLEVGKGHLKWKVTELEAKAKVSRSLIYKYFGSTKPEILKKGIEVFTSHFYGFAPSPKQAPFAERVRASRSFLKDVPEGTIFYLKWREKDVWVSKELHRAEVRFQRKLAKLYPALDSEQVLTVHAFLHGLVTSPFLSAEQAARGAQQLERSLLAFPSKRS
jgi:AcrR family transcriptional regulator